MRVFLVVLACLSAFSAAAAERVRVVIATGLPEAAMSRGASAVALRGEVVRSLRNASRVEEWGDTGAFAAEIDARDLESLRRDPRVRAVSIDDGGEGAMLESLPVVGIDLVRAQGLDGSGVTIAVLDTGIDTDHPDFAGRVVAQQCFCDNGDGTGCCPGGEKERSGAGAAEDDHGHGTHVSGIIAGGGNVAPTGIAPKAAIVSVKVMNGANKFRSFTQIFRGLEWILHAHPEAAVINMSLGSSTLFSSADCANAAVALGMEPVVTKLRERGVLITASSGNSASLSGTTLPACMAAVLGIGATYDADMSYRNGVCESLTAKRDEVVCFTNSTDSIDLLAPGAVIVSSFTQNRFASLAGTSMAAPHVA
ncbi:MAG TPA: S8 family serine peptidase, partial [Thermoanaerobaculia bacterium]|nr:S8 family serine peptidase [Thermoanaerobaculia bacterium]